MIIRASLLYRDMLNFFRNQFAGVFLLTVLTALIAAIIYYVLSPSSEQLIALRDSIGNATNTSPYQLVQKMSIEQQYTLLQASTASTLANLIGNVLLVGGLIIMLQLGSKRQSFTLLHVISLASALLPRLLLLIFLITLLVQLGLFLIIIPGVVLAIAFSLAPVIATNNNISAIKAMCLSTSLAIGNLRLLAPAVLLWLAAKAILILLSTQFAASASSLGIAILLNSLNNLISSLLLIYLYRFYMLSQRI